MVTQASSNKAQDISECIKDVKVTYLGQSVNSIIMENKEWVWVLGGPILKKCFQNFPPDPYITLYLWRTENPGV